MKDGTSITDHLNVFNTLLVQLECVEVKFESEDKAITLLCLLSVSLLLQTSVEELSLNHSVNRISIFTQLSIFTNFILF